MKRFLPALLVTLAVTSLSATLSVPTDLADAIRGASLIVRGRVTATRAFADVANGPVTTAVTVAVSDVIKGAVAGTRGEPAFVTFRVPGGELGRYRHVTVGAPTFATNDEAFLFLKRAPDGSMWPVGLSAGVYFVRTGAFPGSREVNPPLVMGYTASVGQVVRGDVRRKPMPAQEFASLVRLVFASQSAAGTPAVRR
jgi:hypothetical protein